MAQNFFGRDPMIWWIGQVTDPEKGKWYNCTEAYRTKTGEDIYTWRCRVRIVGYHDNADDLPDEDLPLAHVLLPAGESTTGGQGRTMEYQGGEVVVGFFADGEDAQQPIVFGTLYKQEYLADEVTESMFNKKNQVDFVPWTPPAVVQKMGPTQINENSVAQSPVMRTMSNAFKSLADKAVSTASDNKIQNRVPCEGNEVGRMKLALGEFKDKIQALKAIAEYDKHLDPVFGTTFNMAEETKLVVGKVHDATTAIIRRTRAYAVQDTLGKLKTELQDKTPKTLQGATGQASQNLIDVMFCNFEKIQDGMLDYLGESISNLAEQALDIPQCAVEDFLGDMFGQVGSILDSQMGDMFGSLGNITGGAIGGQGGMPSDLFDKGLMFADMAEEILECDGIKCPPPTTFSTRNGTFSGVTDDMRGIMAKAALSRLNLPSSAGTKAPNCDTNILQCGPPKIDFMGGGGKGLTAKSVINASGQLIGASILNSGFGFKSPPALSFVDSCDNGYGSSAYPEMGPVSAIDNSSVRVNAAGGVPLFSEDGCPITVGGTGGTTVTLTDGRDMNTNAGPLKACATGGLPVVAGGQGGTQLSNDSCGNLTVGGEGGIPLLVGDTPLVLGEFSITCGGKSPIQDNTITLPNGDKVDHYYEPGPSGELSSDHWDKDGNMGTGPSSTESAAPSVSLSTGIPISDCLNIVNAGSDYGGIQVRGTGGAVITISPLTQVGSNYGASGTNVPVKQVPLGEFSAPGTGTGLTVDYTLVPGPVKLGTDGITELAPYTGAVQSVTINKKGSNYKVGDILEIPLKSLLDPMDTEGTPARFTITSIRPPTSGGVSVPTSGGSGTGLTLSYDSIDGKVDTVLVANAGTGYKIGDVVTIQSGNNDAQVAITCLKTQLNSQGTSGEGGAGGMGDMRVEVEKERIYVPDPNGLEMGVTDVVIVDSGSAFLPNTVRSELDIDPTSPTFGQVTTKEVKPNPDESYDGETSYLTSLGKVKVKNSGFGYSPNDTATVVSEGGTGPAGTDGTGAGAGGGTGAGAGGGTGGAEVELDIQDGFIVGAKVTKGGSGFTSLPEVRINSDTGVGGRLLPVLKFTKVGDAKKTLAQLPKNIEIVTVIDCVQQ
tara:strand:- start:18216 stop:21545 length:3330 start_codon:yes stop_codon:yes gene_type:complete